MFYECLNPECFCVFQSRLIPSKCPECGGTVLQSIGESSAPQSEYTRKALVERGLSLFSSETSREERHQAYRCFREAAEMADPDGMFYLGLCFEFGYGIEADFQQAVQCYQIASEAGNHAGTCSLAYCYLNGIGVEEDPVRAAELYRKAAEGGNLRAQTNLGVSYSKGIGVPYSPRKAFFWYYLASGFGYAPAMLRLAVCYKNGFGVKKNLKEALRLYRILENMPEPEPEALVAIGSFYEAGEAGLAQDGEKAWEYYQWAAAYGYPEAQWRMGRCCEHGIGVQWDMDRAVQYYMEAARGGSPEAQNELGKCYEAGKGGMKRDLDRAFDCYRLAALRGSPEGAFRLGLCYEKGMGTEPDMERAAKMYQRASGKENRYAQYFLGKAYRRGRGVEKDREKAFYWMKRSADNGCAEASVMLGRWYFHQNRLSEAFRFFRKYEKQTGGKSACSCFYLGRCHLKNVSVQNRKKGISLLKMAESFHQKRYSRMAADLLRRLEQPRGAGPPTYQPEILQEKRGTVPASSHAKGERDSG